MDDVGALVVPILAVLDKATTIASTLSAHRSGPEATVVPGDIVAGLIHVLMTKMNEKEMESSINQAQKIVDDISEGDEDNDIDIDYCEESDESEEIQNVGVSTYMCNCNVCMATRVAILNLPSFEPQSLDQRWVYDAIKSTALKHRISIEGVVEV